MAHTALMNHLIACCRLAGVALERDVPARQVLDEYFAAKADPRSHADLNSKPAADGETIFRIMPYKEKKRLRQPSVVIIGAGLAGLTCAYRLWQEGLRAKVYEASERAGGRCRTIRDYPEEGRIAERGGELIDADSGAIIRLAHEFGLRLDNVAAAEKPGTETITIFNGRPYTYEDATLDFRTIYKKLRRDSRAAGPLTTCCQYTPRGWELDHMSVLEWIDETVPGGARSHFGKLLDIACSTEYGVDSREQNALDIVELLGSGLRCPLELYGMSDEKYHIHGGNDRLVQALMDALPQGTVELGARLTAIRRNRTGSFKLSLSDGCCRWTEDADLAVLAIPFTALRTAVDYSCAGFSPRKTEAIEELGMGTNAKKSYPWALGSYSYNKVGQRTSIGGAQSEPEGNCYFAGAHTSLEFQGFLNGAVESGERAAAEIIDLI